MKKMLLHGLAMMGLASAGLTQGKELSKELTSQARLPVYLPTARNYGGIYMTTHPQDVKRKRLLAHNKRQKRK